MTNERVIELVQVEMLVHTFYREPLKPGDIIEVSQDVAERWERNGIATIVGNFDAVLDDRLPQSPGFLFGDDDADAPDDGVGAKYKFEDLKEIAKDNGIDIAGLRKKSEIIAALQAAGLSL